MIIPAPKVSIDSNTHREMVLTYFIYKQINIIFKL